MGVKKSAKGLLCVMNSLDTSTNEKTFVLYDNVSREQEQTGMLTTLYEDGSFKKHETFEEIRNRVLGCDV